jgi:hypothetical protein
MVFSKEKLLSVGIQGVFTPIASFAVYPNPTISGEASIIYNVEQAFDSPKLTIQNMNGVVVYNASLDGSIGLHQYKLNQPFASGTYLVVISTAEGKMVQKLIVQ